MALKWEQQGLNEYIGSGGKYVFHVKKLHRYYGIARGSTSVDWFEFTHSLEKAKELAEQDVIQHILKESEDSY